MSSIGKEKREEVPRGIGRGGKCGKILRVKFMRDNCQLNLFDVYFFSYLGDEDLPIP